MSGWRNRVGTWARSASRPRSSAERRSAQVPAEFQITDLPGFFDRAAIGRTSAVSISGIFVLDGSNFFELYCGLPACPDDALKSGATIIGGRLPGTLDMSHIFTI
jgi:hypothetical protein